MDSGTNDRVEAERLIRVATEWARGDVDPVTRAALTKSIERRDLEEIGRACARPLQFGTAGLRGEVGPGPGRMNLAVVAKVSLAIGGFLRARVSDAPRVIVGFDARPDSERFARYSAEVLGGCGVEVLLAPQALPTPIVAYGVRRMKAQAGIVVTASHNPRADNGFKVFDDQGAQIIAPWDDEIAQRMRDAPAAQSIVRDAGRVLQLPAELERDYFRDAARTAEAHVYGPWRASSVALAYTPLHGVGWSAVQQALEAMGHRVVVRAVPSQAVPDGAFPTIAFPNPEEPGALDLLLDEAKKSRLDCACANDPDADRFAVCLPLGSTDPVLLSGDALGLLFADSCLKASCHQRPVVVSTVVSSPALESLVEERGGRLIRTLTGFKWICHAAAEEEQFVFAYEEAMGYCFGAPPGSVAAMDKDGIVALLVFARMLGVAGGAKQLVARLLDLYKRVGLWGSFGHSRRWEGPEGAPEMAALLNRIRGEPPEDLAGLHVVTMKDFSRGGDGRPWYLGEQDLLQIDLEGGTETSGSLCRGRILIRPSGTESKLKAYIHLCSNLERPEDYSALHEEQTRRAGEIAQQLLGSGH